MTLTPSTVARIRGALIAARLPLPLRSDGMAKVWGRSPKHGDSHVLDIRGWGELTGKGHGALGLPEAEATAIQDARAELFSELVNNVDALLAAAEAEAEAWRPITGEPDTGKAPWDGERYDLFDVNHGKRGLRAPDSYWHKKAQQWMSKHYDNEGYSVLRMPFKASHYMPLATPPTPEAKP